MRNEEFWTLLHDYLYVVAGFIYHVTAYLLNKENDKAI